MLQSYKEWFSENRESRLFTKVLPLFLVALTVLVVLIWTVRAAHENNLRQERQEHPSHQLFNDFCSSANALPIDCAQCSHGYVYRVCDIASVDKDNLALLVDAYNADPNTARKITVDGFIEACKHLQAEACTVEEFDYEAMSEFCAWCSSEEKVKPALLGDCFPYSKNVYEG